MTLSQQTAQNREKFNASFDGYVLCTGEKLGDVPEVYELLDTLTEETWKAAQDAFITEHKPITDFKCSSHEDPLPDCLQCRQDDIRAAQEEVLERVRAEIKTVQEANTENHMLTVGERFAANDALESVLSALSTITNNQPPV